MVSEEGAGSVPFSTGNRLFRIGPAKSVQNSTGTCTKIKTEPGKTCYNTTGLSKIGEGGQLEEEQILKNLIRLREETREYKAGIEALREKLKSNVERGKTDGKLYKEISNCLLRLVDDYFSYHSKWVNETLNLLK